VGFEPSGVTVPLGEGEAEAEVELEFVIERP
jgi:hypothetical protein